MTRFARARGSNASNERVPEDATPWKVMRNQLLERNQNGKEADERAKFEAIRQQNYEKFLKEQKEKNTTETWCQFEDSKPMTVPLQKDKIKKKKKPLTPESGSEMSGDDERLVKWCNEQESDDEYKDLYKDLTSKLETMITESENTKRTDDNCSFREINNKSKLKKKKINHVSEGISKETAHKKKKHESAEENCFQQAEGIAENTSKKKKKKHESAEENCFQQAEGIAENTFKKKKNKNTEENCLEISEKEKIKNIENSLEIVEKISKKKKKKNAKEKSEEKHKIEDISTMEEIVEKIPIKKKHKNVEEITSEKVSKKKKRNSETQEVESKEDNADVGKFVKNASILNDGEETSTSKRAMKRKLKRELKWKDRLENENETHPPESKKPKLIVAENQRNKTKEKTRRKPENQNTIIIVDGEKLEVAYYDGFPILAKDMERLKELRKSMISKSIPKSEVDRTMKLERRRAEKSFARIKRKQCFHCRKAGHNLSECPELNKASENIGAPSSGICFKCGSTEHTHFNCKVVKNQDYKFAQCFICKEQGHISRQCPDNPRGIYPKGGACKECGDVTHLKKDCPKVVQVREDHSMKLDVMESDNIEDISKKPLKITNNVNKIKRVNF